MIDYFISHIFNGHINQRQKCGDWNVGLDRDAMFHDDV